MQHPSGPECQSPFEEPEVTAQTPGPEGKRGRRKEGRESRCWRRNRGRMGWKEGLAGPELDGERRKDEVIEEEYKIPEGEVVKDRWWGEENSRRKEAEERWGDGGGWKRMQVRWRGE